MLGRYSPRALPRHVLKATKTLLANGAQTQLTLNSYYRYLNPGYLVAVMLYHGDSLI